MNQKFILAAVILTVLFSFSVMAAMPSAPGDFLKNTASFFKGLATGRASMDDAYLISLILYFILFLAIFIEGVRFLPFFGDKGVANKQGKAFAVAAAGLSTIALFVIETQTKISTAERLANLVSPFGVWGGFVIASIIAYITYKMIKDAGLFGEGTAYAMAIAGTVGITFAGLMLSMESLLGWGFVLMILVIIVAAVRAYALERDKTAPERAAKKEEAVQKEVARIKGAEAEAKKKREQQAKEKKFGAVTGFLIKAIEAAEDCAAELKKGKKKEAAAGAEEMISSVKNAYRELRRHRNLARGEEREAYDRLITANLQIIINEFDAEVVKKIKGKDWKNNAAEIAQALGAYRSSCGLVLNELNKIIKH